MSFKNPELNRYAYQLVGFDDEWQYTDAGRRFAYYNNLESGTYKFHLKATNENGIWNSDIRELTVVVLPPFGLLGGRMSFILCCLLHYYILLIV